MGPLLIPPCSPAVGVRLLLPTHAHRHTCACVYISTCPCMLTCKQTRVNMCVHTYSTVATHRVHMYTCTAVFIYPHTKSTQHIHICLCTHISQAPHKYRTVLGPRAQVPGELLERPGFTLSLLPEIIRAWYCRRLLSLQPIPCVWSKGPGHALAQSGALISFKQPGLVPSLTKAGR